MEFKDFSAETIGSISALTLIMSGDADVVRPEHAVEIFRLLPHAKLAILPLTDHMAMVKRASWESSMIEEFLRAP